jgi:riboflavin transporter FmnP
MGVFAALAYVAMYLIRIPVFGFLTLDPKDAVIGVAAFIIGPLWAFLIAIVVAILEMPISGTGIIGLAMNVASTIAFVGIAAAVYRRKPTFMNALIGLLLGTLCATALMLALNYLLTPLYMGMPRSDVAALLVPVLLPFNLSKGAINGALIMLLYTPVMRALDAIGFTGGQDPVPLPTTDENRDLVDRER